MFLFQRVKESDGKPKSIDRLWYGCDEPDYVMSDEGISSLCVSVLVRVRGGEGSRATVWQAPERVPDVIRNPETDTSNQAAKVKCHSKRRYFFISESQLFEGRTYRMQTGGREKPGKPKNQRRGWAAPPGTEV